jgi:hypothetical protein
MSVVGKAIPPTVISFDMDPDSNLVTDSENVSETYWEKVTFSCTPNCGDQVYARSLGRSGNGVSLRLNAPPNFVEPGFAEFQGGITATLTRAASCVSIDTYAVAPENPYPLQPNTGAPWLEAYDATGKLITDWTTGATRQNADGVLGKWETLSICTGGSYTIASVHFSSASVAANKNGVLGRFDNLSFNTAPIVMPTPIPNPILPPRLP